MRHFVSCLTSFLVIVVVNNDIIPKYYSKIIDFNSENLSVIKGTNKETNKNNQQNKQRNQQDKHRNY